MFRYVLKLLAIIATWLIVQSGYDLRVRVMLRLSTHYTNCDNLQSRYLLRCRQ